MNEFTLNGLTNLFAIYSARSASGKAEAQAAFARYLKLHLGLPSPNEYTLLFDELIDLYGIVGEPLMPVDLEEQARKIALNLKGRLQHHEQVIALLRFMELSRLGNDQKAKELISILAAAFSIPDQEIGKYRQFINYEDPSQLDGEDFLLLNHLPQIENKKIRHLQRMPFMGEILFFFLKPAGHYLFQFKGRENIYIEGNPVLPARFYAFREGSILRGPRIEPVYYRDIVRGFAPENLPAFELYAKEVSFTYKNSNNGLAPFSFRESSGQLIAIMGGSGVGKSTLLNLLNGNLKPHNGRICINGIDIHSQKEKARGWIGFVPQDDLLFEELTVWENILYNARLCFAKWQEHQIQEKVQLVLRDLDLWDCRNQKVGNPLNKTISGGQRKRLNLALELLREPSVLFVDEPTSGLSSNDSEKIMLLLKEQARRGRIIIANIHQPSSAIFKLIDKLWILDKGGKPIYTGNPLDAIIYFRNMIGHVNAAECECFHCGNVNPEQVLEIVETRSIDESGQLTGQRLISPQQWYNLFKENIEPWQLKNTPKNTQDPVSLFSIPGSFRQLGIFFSRNLRIKLRDGQSLLISLLEAPVLALIVAWFTRFSESSSYTLFENKNLVSYLFMSIVVVLFMGMSVSAQEIIRDRKILQRESFLNLSRASYLNSKILFLLMLSAYQTLAFVLVGNLVLHIQGMTLLFWMVLFPVAVFSNLLGLNISSGLDSVVAIYILIPLLLIPQILLSGAIVKFDDLQSRTASRDAVPIVGELMVSRWAFEALAVGLHSQNAYMVNFFENEKQTSRSRYLSDLLITELTGRLDQVAGMMKNNHPSPEIDKKLHTLKNEMEKLNGFHHLTKFGFTHDMVPGRFSYQVADSAKAYLQKQKDLLVQKNNQLRNQRDSIANSLKKTIPGGLFALKQHYHNKAIEELVLNTSSREFIRETPEGIMQKIAPVYKKPDFNNGRAHFLSSEKMLAGKTIHTTWFNIAVIWLMTIVLYVALYFDWLRKIINH